MALLKRKSVNYIYILKHWHILSGEIFEVVKENVSLLG